MVQRVVSDKCCAVHMPLRGEQDNACKPPHENDETNGGGCYESSLYCPHNGVDIA